MLVSSRVPGFSWGKVSDNLDGSFRILELGKIELLGLERQDTPLAMNPYQREVSLV
jgi:hypothetical protein